MAKNSKTIYLCQSCGNEFVKWSGRCELCGEWNTLKEMAYEPSDFSTRKFGKIEHKKLDQIKSSNQQNRIVSKISEFDRVLGGGIVSGSLILLGGEPGIGKSTIALELAGAVKDAYYLSAEESLEQVKMRAERVGLKNSTLTLFSGGDLESFSRTIKRDLPKLVVIDSIQTVYLNSINANCGSISQVRESGMYLQNLAKETGVAIIIIGHVTKEGNIAGPRLLEHIVDVVLFMEGERYHDARILRSIKNRFGPTDETGIFTHADDGLVEVKNPSELFLSERKDNPGSAVAVTLEGTRPILVEVQGLTIPTSFGYPRRTASGFSINRLNLLAAVISRNTSINLNNHDIYLKVVGGMKIWEPAVDLAVCAAIISSCKNRAIDSRLVFFGEVGLSGEIRKVTKEKNRINEAKKLGFKVFENKNASLKGLAKIVQ